MNRIHSANCALPFFPKQNREEERERVSIFQKEDVWRASPNRDVRITCANRDRRLFFYSAKWSKWGWARAEVDLVPFETGPYWKVWLGTSWLWIYGTIIDAKVGYTMVEVVVKSLAYTMPPITKGQFTFSTCIFQCSSGRRDRKRKGH